MESTSGDVPVGVFLKDGAVHKFTWRELSKLNEPHNAHIAYRGKVSCYERFGKDIRYSQSGACSRQLAVINMWLQVYNVTSFASKHPGGVDQILCAAGRDITQVFEAYHNPEVAEWVC